MAAYSGFRPFRDLDPFDGEKPELREAIGRTQDAIGKRCLDLNWLDPGPGAQRNTLDEPVHLNNRNGMTIPIVLKGFSEEATPSRDEIAGSTATGASMRHSEPK